MTPEDFEVKACAPRYLSEADLVTCFAIIRSGEAVNPATMRVELPFAGVLVLARQGKRIVGVGAIKRVRLLYASKIGTRSGFRFDKNTRELGYVAVDTGHRGHGLSHRIVAKLLSKHQGPLFATTSAEPMKRTLARAGFVQEGHEWDGQSGKLSLWLRE